MICIRYDCLCKKSQELNEIKKKQYKYSKVNKQSSTCNRSHLYQICSLIIVIIVIIIVIVVTVSLKPKNSLDTRQNIPNRRGIYI